jgi:hypothetical protein
MAFGAGSLLLIAKCTNAPKSSWRFFTDEEASLVDAIVEQIIPTDEWLGAKDAKVTNYIDKQLAGTLSRFQEQYRNGLHAFNVSCLEIHNTSFQELSWDEQTEFLLKLEKGTFSERKSLIINQNDGLVWEQGADRSFFMQIRNNTMQGYYGSPRHGGNYQHVSYRMIGLDYPVIQGQNRYKENEK